MYKQIFAVVLGVVLSILFAKNLADRKTIVLNSSRMKKLNDNIIKVDNRCYRIDKEVSKCDTKDQE